MKTPPRAFSLVEVLIAVGISAFVVTAVIALLASAARSNADSRERLVADGVAQRAIAEVERMGFAQVLSRLTALSQEATDEQRLFFDREGQLLSDGESNDRFFSAHFRRIEPLSSPSRDALGTFVAFTVRVEWPWSNGVANTAPFSIQVNHVALR